MTRKIYLRKIAFMIKQSDKRTVTFNKKLYEESIRIYISVCGVLKIR